jgi:hypothetical protein
MLPALGRIEMARIVKKAGDMFKFSLSDGRYAYAQWLDDGTVRVFKGAFVDELSIDEIAAYPIAFRVSVFKDTPRKYDWVKIGKAEIPLKYSKPVRYYYKQVIGSDDFEIVDMEAGGQVPATASEVEGLEQWAVWAGHNIS